MNSVSKNSAITFLSQLVVFALTLISTMILARVLGPEGQGIYSLLVLVPILIMQLGTFGVEDANVYFTGSKKYKTEDIISNSLIITFLISTVAILLFAVTLHFGIFNDFIISNKINVFYIWLSIFTIPFSLIFLFLNNVFLGKEEVIKFNRANVFQGAVQLSTVILFLLIFRLDIFGAMISYAITVFFTAVFIIRAVQKTHKITLYFNRKLFKKSVVYGSKVYFGTIAQFLNYRLGMFLVAFFSTPLEVGFYSIAVGIAERLWMLPKALAVVLFSKVSSIGDAQGADSLTPRFSRHIFFLILVSSLILAFIAKDLIKIMFGKAFLPSFMPLLILLPGVVALSGARALNADLAGRGRPEIGTLAAIVSLGVNIIFNIYLIPKWGASGAAFATSAAYIISTIITVVIFAKISGKRLPEIIFIKKEDLYDYGRLLSRVSARYLKNKNTKIF